MGLAAVVLSIAQATEARGKELVSCVYSLFSLCCACVHVCWLFPMACALSLNLASPPSLSPPFPSFLLHSFPLAPPRLFSDISYKIYLEKKTLNCFRSPNLEKRGEPRSLILRIPICGSCVSCCLSELRCGSECTQMD